MFQIVWELRGYYTSAYDIDAWKYGKTGGRRRIRRPFEVFGGVGVWFHEERVNPPTYSKTGTGPEEMAVEKLIEEKNLGRRRVTAWES